MFNIHPCKFRITSSYIGYTNLIVIFIDGNPIYLCCINSGCSELAEHVVHRAKVRLKRRQKRNLPTLMRSNVDSQTKALPVSYSPSGSKTNTSPIKVTTNERTEASPNNEQKSIRLSVAAAAGQQGSPYFKRMDVPKTAAVRNLGRQLELTESVNSLGSGPVMTRSFKVVYWSDRQSVTPKDTGIPNVPPVTPSTCE